ncbi:unnamed protein product [Pieris brassicae]|uniref:U4/U6.U5 small nuclear ribonucleoprotein 27 kDa protein n=1 Tax=Pieris brassicae TaxID=7116 RepID=A0A9P0TT06_PIEBR|nr:unnamed protein product [Pieris brassicae]
MGRSPSPRRRDRDDRRERRDRDRDRDRRRRTRSRSRSLERRRRSPDRERRRSPSPRRRRSRSLSPGPSTSFVPKPKKSYVERPIVTPADLEGKSPEEQEMLKVMGFCGFDTTKGLPCYKKFTDAPQTFFRNSQRRVLIAHDACSPKHRAKIKDVSSQLPSGRLVEAGMGKEV